MNDLIEKARNGRVVALAGLSSNGYSGARSRAQVAQNTVTFVSFRARQKLNTVGA